MPLTKTHPPGSSGSQKNKEKDIRDRARVIEELKAHGIDGKLRKTSHKTSLHTDDPPKPGKQNTPTSLPTHTQNIPTPHIRSKKAKVSPQKIPFTLSIKAAFFGIKQPFHRAFSHNWVNGALPKARYAASKLGHMMEEIAQCEGSSPFHAFKSIDEATWKNHYEAWARAQVLCEEKTWYETMDVFSQGSDRSFGSAEQALRSLYLNLHIMAPRYGTLKRSITSLIEYRHQRNTISDEQKKEALKTATVTLNFLINQFRTDLHTAFCLCVGKNITIKATEEIKRELHWNNKTDGWGMLCQQAILKEKAQAQENASTNDTTHDKILAPNRIYEGDTIGPKLYERINALNAPNGVPLLSIAQLFQTEFENIIGHNSILDISSVHPTKISNLLSTAHKHADQLHETRKKIETALLNTPGPPFFLTDGSAQQPTQSVLSLGNLLIALVEAVQQIIALIDEGKATLQNGDQTITRQNHNRNSKGTIAEEIIYLKKWMNEAGEWIHAFSRQEVKP